VEPKLQPFFGLTFLKSCFGSTPLFKKVVQNFGSTFLKGGRVRLNINNLFYIFSLDNI
jgi:hypothetical protein